MVCVFQNANQNKKLATIFASFLVGADRRSFEYADPNDSEGNAQKTLIDKILPIYKFFFL
ncbi:MAG: hypothetical protein P1P64_04230 [Treponemataceae bacterium]